MALQEAKGNLATIVVFYNGKPYALVCDADSLLRISLAASEITLPIDIKSQTITPNVDLYQARGEPVGQPNWVLAQYIATAQNEDTAAGTVTLSLTAIPAGDIVELESVTAWFTSATVNELRIQITDGVTAHTVMGLVNPVNNQRYPVNAKFTLTAGCYARAIILNASAHDKLYITAWGKKIQD